MPIIYDLVKQNICNKRIIAPLECALNKFKKVLGE